ncbi:hydroxyneurosporene-O-methyltransferase [Mycolicibacterium arabiense]|uniref:Hydroxyneurosporene-O-methyltransferase n=1 Tax=Mycolicibacterium arabiense TaxID=1286181 RepID=A0A7I7RUB1_9MYCO|nr:methyltransferase [Mycolicibacterium arabiense]MCV7373517.1 hydroxyneurosporene methyltransferase [Mycolicibacterium arabiense]BBY48147.1 hydroxyneurosporene-O-methyltransferase [Mycolicibacterium arabiense]
MTVPSKPKAPPAWLIDGIGRVRSVLTDASRAAVPPNIVLLEMAQGAWLTQALYIAAELGIADALRDGPRTADDVAQLVDAKPDATYRVMRALAANGVLTLRRDGRFALTRVGQALRSDHEGSMAPMIKLVGRAEHWEHWSRLMHSVRTGQTAVEALRGMSAWDYLESNPEYAAVFNDAMTGVSAVAIETAVPLYDFADRKLVVDVGGGHGALLAKILTQTPTARGVLFDLPTVVEGARPILAAAGVADRCTVEDGSFFDSVPDGADAYVMKTVIHDWDDEEAVAILRNVRTAIADGGKLLLFEMVLPEGAPPHPGMLLDLEMLVHAGGRERTAREYADLLARGGFRLKRVIATPGPMSIVEALPA